MTLGFRISLVSNIRQETFCYFNSPTSFILFKKESVTLISSTHITETWTFKDTVWNLDKNIHLTLGKENHTQYVSGFPFWIFKMKHNVWLSKKMKCQWPMFSSPSSGISVSLNVSKGGSTKTESKVRPSKSVTWGVNRCTHCTQPPARSSESSMRWVWCADCFCCTASPFTYRHLPSWDHWRGVPCDVLASSPSKYAPTHVLKKANLNLNLNFKVEEKNSICLFPFSRIELQKTF